MSTKILDVLGTRYGEIKLYDDNSLSHGGLSRAEETLGEFMEETGISPLDDVGKLQKALIDCGIEQISAIDENIQHQIEDYLQDLEDELGITIDFVWNFVEFNK